jgi:hypothetical protein
MMVSALEPEIVRNGVEEKTRCMNILSAQDVEKLAKFPSTHDGKEFHCEKPRAEATSRMWFQSPASTESMLFV